MANRKPKRELRNTVVEEVDGSEGARMRDDLKAAKAADRTPVVASTETETEAPEKEEKKQPALQQRIRAVIFCRATGIRDDQAAGFLYHVKKNKLGARSIPEWKKVWDAFMNRPVK